MSETSEYFDPFLPERKPRREKAAPEPFVPSPALSPEEKRLIPRPEPLPMTAEEVAERGWTEVDIVFVTGDAYVDHPSFATGLLGRVLEAEGFRVAILSQPNWRSCEDWKRFGRPRLGFCVSAGNMDSMINHYTANRKVRNDDAYSPNGEIGHRPDRATLAYCQRAREAYPGIHITTGGIEASLRRLAHYDYWSDKVKRSILMDSKAGLLAYGMGESPLRQIYHRLDKGEAPESIRDVRGSVYRIGKTEDLPEESEDLIYLPSFEEVQGDPNDPEEDKKSKELFATMTRIAYENLNPYCAKTLVQEHGEEAIVVNPPAFPLTTEELDKIYNLPFTRKPHPSYGNNVIPAAEVVKDSVTILRGCFGGCAFCSLTAHQGKIIQSRSDESILSELKTLAERDDFSGTVSDLGGPTANMFRMDCGNEVAKRNCRKPSCLHPSICPNLKTDHRPVLDLYAKARKVPGIKNIFIASGVRTDLALESPEYIEELIKYHIGGHLKTAPEHVDPAVLNLMQKPPIEVYEEFCDIFANLTRKNGKEQYLVPYLIAGLPGCNYQSMVKVAEYLKKNNIRPEQVQDFIPTPFELAGTIYYTGLNPFTMEKVYVPRGLRERRLQHALLMYYNPAYYHDVKSALKEAKREDLIGNGPECLIPPYPPKIDNLRQTSRVKRLQKRQMAEQEEKERRRQEFREKEWAKREKENRKKGKFPPSGHSSKDRPPFDSHHRKNAHPDRSDSDRNWRFYREGDDSGQKDRRFHDNERPERNGRQFHDDERSERNGRRFQDNKRPDRRDQKEGGGNYGDRRGEFSGSRNRNEERHPGRNRREDNSNGGYRGNARRFGKSASWSSDRKTGKKGNPTKRHPRKDG